MGLVGFDHPMKEVNLDPLPLTFPKYYLNSRTMEVWKDIEGYEGYYQVSNNGNVKSCVKCILATNRIINRKEKLLKPWTCDGYKIVKLYRKNIPYTTKVHRLVGIAFIPNPEKKPQINHIDSDRANNHVYNLEWATASENAIHGYTYGDRSTQGVRHPQSKFTEKEILAIRSIDFSQITRVRIAKIYGVVKTTVSAIVNRQNWKHL